MSIGVALSFTSQSAAITFAAPACRKAHARPTSPSPVYVRVPAPWQLEMVTSRAESRCCTTSRASNLYWFAESRPRITADSSGRVRKATPCATKCTKSNVPGDAPRYALGVAAGPSRTLRSDDAKCRLIWLISSFARGNDGYAGSGDGGLPTNNILRGPACSG